MQKKLFALLISILLAGISFAGAPRTGMPDNNPLAAKYRTTLFNRFLTYTTYDSQSNDDQDITPEQIETAKKLYEQIKS